jgi:hypothetical protein
VLVPSQIWSGAKIAKQLGVRLARQEDEERRARQEAANLGRIVENEAGEEDDTEDDKGDGDERDIWEVAHVTEEDFETTEGEAEDLDDKLMEMAGWKVTDNSARMRMT